MTGYSTMLSSKIQSGSFGDLLRTTQQPKAIQIRLVRSGHNAFKAEVPMQIFPQQYASLGDLLKEATTTVKAANVPLNRGGIKSLYTIHGKEIKLVHDLEDKVVYIATCANELFKSIPYASSIVTQKPSMHSVATSTTSLVSGHGDSQLKPRRITLVRQGKRPRQIFSLLLNKKTAHGFEKVLSDISELVHLDAGPLHIVFTQSGRQVTCLEDFFGYHYIFFAFRKEMAYSIGDFVLDQMEMEIINKINRRPSEKCVISPPVKSKTINELLTREIAPQIRVKYNIVRNIYKGQFLALNECTSKGANSTTAVRYAMKIISKTEKNYQCIRNEVLMMKGLRHSTVIRLLNVHDSPPQVYMILELATDGDLYTALLNSRISEDEAKTFTENIVSALFYIHCSYIVHRNVKPSNLLITRDSSGRRVVKLTGFSLACVAFEPLYEICGRTLYMAPEMLRGSGYGGKVDVWAAGVVVYYMLVQVPPFLGETDDDDERLILDGKVDFSWEEWSDISFDAKELISFMLHSEKDSRYTAEEVLEHPWIIERTGHEVLRCSTGFTELRNTAQVSLGGIDKYVSGNVRVESKLDEDEEDIKTRSGGYTADSDDSTCVNVADGDSVYKSEEWETDCETDTTEDVDGAVEDQAEEISNIDNDALALDIDSVRNASCDGEKYERVTHVTKCCVDEGDSTSYVRECDKDPPAYDRTPKDSESIHDVNNDEDLQEELSARNDGQETDSDGLESSGQESDRTLTVTTHYMKHIDEDSPDEQEKYIINDDERDKRIETIVGGNVGYDQEENCRSILDQVTCGEFDNVYKVSETDKTCVSGTKSCIVETELEVIIEDETEDILPSEDNAFGDYRKDSVKGAQPSLNGFGDKKSVEVLIDEEDDEWEDAV